ncbi:MAG: UDP-N-acetylmuramoyl-tripeptide--D-alanyl-D-alanine ligase [Defluviitaleaceae bacterium]|nr:UDP-N-acetylmuramoyl-tripeptide--D-alanyl-D-alanine ligase [Defluviitaleaceae bacterium]MCL2275439.1 UDP-N-acetylmuramoyl-tripeptide--D-alanyl-D-alanine ligase [Defluviitaleaceae bacterium]
MRLSIQEVAEACKGKILYSQNIEGEITSVSINTREIEAGAVFFPFKGERVDGHDFIAQAAEKGATCAFTEREDSPNVGIPLIFVPSTRKAIMDLAAYYRRRHDVKVIAVAGSAGKTTTKEMVAALLSQRFTTKKTYKNYNNDIGLPLSIFQLTPEDKAIVLEMGMNRPNEITPLSKISAPDIAVVTLIDDEHMENFPNREGVLHANLEIVDGLNQNGIVVLNGEDPLLTGDYVKEKTRPFTVHYLNASHIIEAQPNGLTDTRCHFRINDTDIHLTVPLPGHHMVTNALLAATVAIEMGLSPQEISDGFDVLTMPEGRLAVLEANGMTVINDTYNANPASIKAAIKVLLLESRSNCRRVCILGDMNELGHVSEARHHEVGIYAAKAGIDLLISIGEMARHLHEGYLSATDRVFSALHFPTTDAFLSQWKTLLFSGDILLIKASRGMAFEAIVTAITEENP